MFLINQAMVDVPIGTAALIVVLGMAVVFFGLILLMLGVSFRLIFERSFGRGQCIAPFFQTSANFFPIILGLGE